MAQAFLSFIAGSTISCASCAPGGLGYLAASRKFEKIVRLPLAMTDTWRGELGIKICYSSQVYNSIY
jgi:hypothetical protein